MSLLREPERRELLKLARQALIFSVEHRRPLLIAPHMFFNDPAGVFVTLRKGKRLRGCIGRLDVGDALAQTIANCTHSAAREDPRFEPVTTAEIPELTIELSVISPASPIFPQDVKTGVHGLIVTRGGRRGVLLPQVAIEHGLDAQHFLEETCVKSGLPRDAWKDSGTLIEAFTAEVFSEEDFTGAESVSAD